MTSASSRRDEVDDIVDSWSRERPDLDVRPLHVLSRITRLARHLDRARAAAFTQHALETWEFDVLAALRRSGPPYALTAGALSTETMVTSGTMTNRVDRLIERCLVTRNPDPADGRGVLVALTDAGRQRVDDALTDLLAREEQLLAALTSDDREVLTHALRSLGLPFDQID